MSNHDSYDLSKVNPAYLPKKPANRGRALPIVLIDKFKTLIKSGLNLEQAAEALDINPKLYKRLLPRLAREAATELRLELMQALANATQSSAAAAIFAAKAKLGWQDVQKIESMQAIEYIDLPVNETRKDWEQRQGMRLVKKA